MLLALRDKIIVEPSEGERETPGGIVLPETSQQRSDRGTVVAKGAGRIVDGKLIPLCVDVGDEVYFQRFGVQEIEFEGDKYFVLREDDILAVVGN